MRAEQSRDPGPQSRSGTCRMARAGLLAAVALTMANRWRAPQFTADAGDDRNGRESRPGSPAKQAG